MEERRILLVDDEQPIHSVLRRALGKPPHRLISAYGGVEAVDLAQTVKPDLILLDINMPDKDGREVLKEIRRNIQTQMIPVVLLTGNGRLPDKLVGFELGADDYVSKPFEMTELRARIESICRRNHRDLTANPLTRLPGGPAIEDEVNRRIREKKAFAFLYVDIDHFKPFNDVYGYALGDYIIQETASLLVDALTPISGASHPRSSLLLERGSARDGVDANSPGWGQQNDFVGHIGGDDFVVLTSPERVDPYVKQVIRIFDEKAPWFYNALDRARGGIVTRDRQDQERSFPFISLSIAAVTNERRRLGHYAKVVDIAAEVKRYLKTKRDRRGSAFLKDRRSDDRRES